MAGGLTAVGQERSSGRRRDGCCPTSGRSGLDLRHCSKVYGRGVTSLRISQLAERSGVPATTLRFYEGAGCCPPAGPRPDTASTARNRWSAWHSSARPSPRRRRRPARRAVRSGVLTPSPLSAPVGTSPSLVLVTRSVALFLGGQGDGRRAR
ncbi:MULTISPECIES: MerR family transcriptional regulator [unclassified Kitasatospora]|uniref:MerR family transcriptional regulator n=1 Tax=unclassified Kitasatospora TaxID=2633591 RepID=UPI0032B00535